MVGKSMWSWAKDSRLRDEFDGLNLVELLVLISSVSLMPFLEIVGFIFGFNHRPSNMLLMFERYLWWAGFVIIIARTTLLCLKTHWPLCWAGELGKVDLRIYLYFFVVVFAYFLLAFWPGISDNLWESMNFIVGDKKISFLKIWGGFLSVLQQELEYRLVLYYSLNRVFGRHVAFPLSCIIFGFAHESSFSYQTAVALGGSIFSLLTIASGSIIPAVILHSIINLSALFLAIALK